MANEDDPKAVDNMSVLPAEIDLADTSHDRTQDILYLRFGSKDVAWGCRTIKG